MSDRLAMEHYSYLMQTLRSCIIIVNTNAKSGRIFTSAIGTTSKYQSNTLQISLQCAARSKSNWIVKKCDVRIMVAKIISDTLHLYLHFSCYRQIGNSVPVL